MAITTLAATAGWIVRYLKAPDPNEQIEEVIVVDGKSTDGTRAVARRAGAKVLTCLRRGRAIQMNCDAREASGDILYFLHADSIPPSTYTTDIVEASQKNKSGCYRLAFDHFH